MDVTIRNLKRMTGLVLLGLLVPGGSLIVLATLLAERAWQRNGSAHSSPPCEVRKIETEPRGIPAAIGGRREP
jgi:hypothetical protein